MSEVGQSALSFPHPEGLFDTIHTVFLAKPARYRISGRPVSVGRSFCVCAEAIRASSLPVRLESEQHDVCAETRMGMRVTACDRSEHGLPVLALFDSVVRFCC